MTQQALNFNLEFPSRIITVRDNAINWVWYNQYHLYTGFDKIIWALPLASDRIHKFDDRQGAENHPSNDTPNLFSGDYYHRPDYSQIKAFGLDVIKNWEKACEKLGVRDYDCGTILTIRKVNDEVMKLPIRPK